MSEQEIPSADQQAVDQPEILFGKVLKTTEETIDLIGKLTLVADPGAVFSKPVHSGEYTVITASELAIGLGAGFGSGAGGDPSGGGAGGGGGGGGSALGRPVAVISIGPNGVHVEPVVDPTKIAIAFFTTLVAMFMALRATIKAFQ
jgi:uncharacterized spore protein YtfJ